jgi:hypothetical protein
MARSKITLRVRVRWWVRPYLAGVALTSRLTGLEPDWKKVAAHVRRGTYVTLEQD